MGHFGDIICVSGGSGPLVTPKQKRGNGCYGATAVLHDCSVVLYSMHATDPSHIKNIIAEMVGISVNLV